MSLPVKRNLNASWPGQGCTWDPLDLANPDERSRVIRGGNGFQGVEVGAPRVGMVSFTPGEASSQ